MYVQQELVAWYTIHDTYMYMCTPVHAHLIMSLQHAVHIIYMYTHTTCVVHAPEDLQQYRGIWTGHARTRLALHNIQCVALFNGTDFLTAGDS